MKTFSSLPNELIALITDLLDDADLINLHSASRELHSLSDAAFRGRLCKTVYIEVSLANLKKWAQLLRPGEMFSAAETMVLSPAFVPDILDDHWFGDERDGFECPSAYDLDHFRLVQKGSGYVGALEEQWHLLESGRFVSDVAGMLACLPNLRRIKIEDRVSVRLSANEPLVQALNYAWNRRVGRHAIADSLGALSTASSSSERARAACRIVQDLALLQRADRRQLGAALLQKLTSSGGADERRLMVKSWGDCEAVDPRCPTSVVGPGSRTASKIMPGGRRFLRSLISALVEIRAGCDHRARKPGCVSVGCEEVAVEPDNLPPAHAASSGLTTSTTTCDAESLELVLRWPAAKSRIESRIQASVMKPSLNGFLRHFPSLTELSISGTNLNIATSLGLIETLKMLVMSRVRCHAGELSQFLRPDQWQHLEALSLVDIHVSQDWYGPPDGEDELALRNKWAGKADASDLDWAFDFDGGTPSDWAWTEFLQSLEKLPTLLSFKLSGPPMRSNAGQPGGDEDDDEFHDDMDDWDVDEMVVTRDPGSSWKGRLSAIANVIYH